MKDLPVLGSVWTSTDLSKFKVEKLRIDNNSIWIFYKNLKTEKEYNCLVNAFLDRFNEVSQ